MSRFRKLGLQNGQGYFKRIKDFTDAWQTMHNENIALKDIEQYDEELFCRLSCLSELLSNDGYMDFSFAIYLAVQELKKIDKKEGSLKNLNIFSLMNTRISILYKKNL